MYHYQCMQCGTLFVCNTYTFHCKQSILNNKTTTSNVFFLTQGEHLYVTFINMLYGVYMCLFVNMVFSACVAAVKCRPILHHCVVIFFWSSGIMECTCMLFTFVNGVPLMR